MAQDRDATEPSASVDAERRHFLQAGLAATGTVIGAPILQSSMAAVAAPAAATNTSFLGEPDTLS